MTVPRDTMAGIDYTQTARRPAWAALPGPVRDRICTELRAPVDRVEPAGGGFTNGFAAVVSGGRHRLFIKAAPATDGPIFDAYVREAEVLGALPAGLPVPRLHAADLLRAGGSQWQLLCFEAVNGHMPGRPWTVTDLGAVHQSLLKVQTGLRRLPPGLSGGSMVDDFFGTGPLAGVLDCWGRDGGLPAYLPQLNGQRMSELQELTRLGRVALTGDSVLHNDLRADNIIIRGTGVDPGKPAAVFCDWNFLSTGPAWADWVALLVYPRHAGIDVDPWIAESPLCAGADPDHLDAWLAVLAALMVTSGAQPELATSPLLRAHQRFTARILIQWISERRLWEL